jgi:hypothetical protein
VPTANGLDAHSVHLGRAVAYCSLGWFVVAFFMHVLATN